MVVSFGRDVGQQQLFGLGRGEYFELVCVFYVHDLVADVVGRLYEVYQGVAVIDKSALAVGEHPEVVGYAAKVFAFRGKEAQLAFLGGEGRSIRIFDDRSQRRVGEGKTSRAAAVELVCQQPECVGVTLEVSEVFPLPFVQLPFECKSVAF